MEKTEKSKLIQDPEMHEDENIIKDSGEDPSSNSSESTEKGDTTSLTDSDLNINANLNDIDAEEETNKDSQDNVKDVINVTASLWQYNPVPESEPEPFPEYLTRFYKNDTVEIIGARVRGKKHKHEGTNCDDWFEFEVGTNATYIAVSDGAGSKKYSRIGAKCACKAAVGYLKSTIEELFSNNETILSDISLSMDDPQCFGACKKVAGILQKS